MTIISGIFCHFFKKIPKIEQFYARNPDYQTLYFELMDAKPVWDGMTFSAIGVS